MKKVVGILLVCLLLLTLCACGNMASPSSSGEADASFAVSAVSTPTPEATPTPVPESHAAELEQPEETSAEEPAPSEATQSTSNILVVYFSRTGEQYSVGVIDKGNTAIVAEMIVEATGADFYEILPAEDTYPMTYDELTDVALKEQQENARPALAGELPDLSGYDTIFIGAPVWWGDWPMICYTFFESADLTGKTVYPFSTHAGSGLSGFDTKLQNAAPGVDVGNGLAVRGADCQNNPEGVRSAVTSWLEELGY